MVCRATSAAPTFFDPVEIGKYGEKFIDGATGCNNPIEEVYSSARERWPPQASNTFSESIQCLVSIGTGVVPDEPFGSRIFEIARALTNIATETEATADRFKREHADLWQASKYFRFNVHGLGSIGLEEEAKKSEITSRTNSYVKSPAIRDEMVHCANSLSNFDLRGVQGLSSNTLNSLFLYHHRRRFD